MTARTIENELTKIGCVSRSAATVTDRFRHVLPVLDAEIDVDHRVVRFWTGIRIELRRVGAAPIRAWQLLCNRVVGVLPSTVLAA